MSKEIGFKIGDKKIENTAAENKPAVIAPEEEIKKIISVIKLRFVPVSTIKESNVQLSTGEFADKIREHYPGALFIADEEVYKMLQDSGFVYTMVGNEIQWLIKRK